jgi:hypothetical protein
MFSKKQTLIFSSAGLVLLIALTVILMLIQREPGTDDNIPDAPQEDKTVQFTEFEAGDVVSISVKNEHGEYTVERNTNGDFIVPALLGAPTIHSRLHNSARYMSNFWAREIVAENVEPLYQYGLEDTAARAFVTFANGGTLEIFVGDETPTPEDLTYVRVIREGSKDTVYAVWSYLVDWLKEPALYYVSLEVTPSFMDAGWPQIDRLVIDRAGHEQYIIELVPRLYEDELIINSHRLLAPIQVEVDHDKGSALIQGLFGLTAAEAVFVGAELSGELARVFDEPEAVITMTLGSYVSSLIVGGRYFTQNDDGENVFSGFYGVHSDYPDVLYIFSPQMLNRLLSFDAESIMAAMFHRPLIYTVAEFIIETPAHSLSFTLTGEDRNDEQYFLHGELIDINTFKDLYIFALMMSAEALFKGTPEDTADMPLLARYTYRYRDPGAPETVIEFYDIGDMRSVIAVNGDPRFTTRTGYLTRLEHNLEAYLNNEPIINSW